MNRLAHTAIVMLLFAQAAQGHHSYGDFHRDQQVTIEGEIVGVLYAHPHVLLRVQTPDAGTWVIEWGSPVQLIRQSVMSDTLNRGERIIVTGSPMRDPERRTLSLLQEVHRPADGWRWTRWQRR